MHRGCLVQRSRSASEVGERRGKSDSSPQADRKLSRCAVHSTQDDAKLVKQQKTEGWEAQPRSVYGLLTCEEQRFLLVFS